MQDNRDILYDNLIKSGKVNESQIGTKEQFKNAIKDENSAAQFHDNLLKAGFGQEEIGDSKLFYNSIASDFKPSNTSPHVSPYVEGTGENTKVFGMPYNVFKNLKLESKKYYYEEAQRTKAEAQANDIKGRAQSEYDKSVSGSMDEQIKAAQENPFLFAAMSSGMPGDVNQGIVQKAQTTPEALSSKAAIKKAENVQEVIDTSRRKANGTNTLKELGKGFYDKAKKLSTWDFGVSDMNENGALLSAAMKKEKGEPLDDSEKTLLESAALEALSDEKFRKDVSMPYRMGATTAESASYMKDFLLSGGLQGLGEAAVKKFGTEAAKKTTGQIIKNAILRTAGDMVGAAGMSSTIHAGNVIGDTFNREVGDVQFNQDKEGNAQFAGTQGGEAMPKAATKAFAANTINDFSEMVGEYFAPAIGKAGDVIASTKPFKALKATKVGDMINRMSTSDWAKAVNDFEKNAQFHGAFGEYAEEVVGNAMNAAIVGDQSWSDVVDPKQNVETFLSVSLMSGIMSSSKAIGYRKPKLEAERKLSQAESEANNVYGSQFGEIKSALENASVEDRKDYLSKVASSSMDEGKKKAIFNFVGRLTELEGMNEAEQKAEQEGSVPEGIERNKSEIYANFEDAKKKAESIPQEELDYYEAHPEKLPESQSQDVIEDYLTAKSDFDGYLNHVSNKIQTAKINARKQVEGVANPDMNAIVRVSSKNSDQPTHVVGGTLVFDDEGNVDEQQSSPVIYYLDEQGKRKMAPPSTFASLVDSTPIENMASQAEQDAEQQVVEQEEAELPQEAPTLEVGSNITTSTGITGEVTRFTPEGEAVVSDGQQDYIVPSDNILSINGQSTDSSTIDENNKEEPQNINTSVSDEENNILSNNKSSDETIPSVKQSNLSETAPAEQKEDAFPLDKDGNVDYKQIGDPETYAKALKKEFGEDALPIVEEDITNQQKQLSHAEKKGNAIEKARAKKRINQELSRLESIKSLLSPQKENEVPNNITTDEEYADWAAENSDDPTELAAAYGVAKEQSSHENTLLPWQRELLGRKINTNSFNRFGDRNKINGTFAKAWLRKDGEDIDALAQELSGFGNEVTENDIVDFMLGNPTNYVRTTSDLQKKLAGRFSEVASKEMGIPVGGPESNTGKLYLELKKANQRLDQLSESQTKDVENAILSDYKPEDSNREGSYLDNLDDEQMAKLASIEDGNNQDRFNEESDNQNTEENDKQRESGSNSDVAGNGERLEGSTGEGSTSDIDTGVTTESTEPEGQDRNDEIKPTQSQENDNTIAQAEKKVNTNPSELDRHFKSLSTVVARLNTGTGQSASLYPTQKEVIEALLSDGVEKDVVDEIEATFTQAQEEGTKFPGFFDSKTGKIYLCANQIKDKEELKRKYSHEATHAATNNSLTNEQLEYLYNTIGKDAIKEYVPDYYFENDLSKTRLADEYLSYVAEDIVNFANNEESPVDIEDINDYEERKLGIPIDPGVKQILIDNFNWIQNESENDSRGSQKDNGRRQGNHSSHDEEDVRRRQGDVSEDRKISTDKNSDGRFERRREEGLAIPTHERTNNGSNREKEGQSVNGNEELENTSDKRRDEKNVVTSSHEGTNTTVNRKEETEKPAGREEIAPNGSQILFREEESSPEMEKIKNESLTNGSFMKAPNGKKTNLNERQWLQVRTPKFKEWFGDLENSRKKSSKVVDENGEPRIVFHGSPTKFYEFSTKYMGTNGTSEGQGLYFTSDKKVSQGYQTEGGILFDVYLNIRKPLNSDKKTITKAQLKSIIKALDSDGGGFLSNYGDVSYEGYDQVLNEAVNSEYDNSENDVDLVGGLINGSGSFEDVYEALSKTTGHDGIIENGEWGKGQTIYVASQPHQIKSATDNTGEFSSNNNDIRFRKNETNMNNVADRVYRLSAAFSRNINGRKPAFVYSETGKLEYKPNSFVEDFSMEASLLQDQLKALKEDASDAAKKYIQDFIDRLDDQTKYYKQLDKNGGVSSRDFNVLYHRITNSVNDLLNEIKPNEISKSISEISDKLKTPVRIIHEISEIDDENKSLEKRKRSSKGWFDPSTNEIVVVLPNATSVADAQRTMLHEIVGHKGLRGLFGDNFDEAITDIFKALPQDVKKSISTQAVSKYNFDMAKATEEYLAEQAESGANPSIWHKVVSAIRDLFRKAGISLKLTDNDIKYLLWRSRNNLENGTIEERMDKKMRDLDIRDKLFREMPKEEKVSPTLDSNALSKENIGDQIKIAQEAVELTDEEKKDFSAKLRNDRFREGWQDRMLPLRRFQELVFEHTGRKIEEFCDAYNNENTIASRSTYEIDQFKNDYLKPLVNVITQLGDAELTKSYMKAKHGMERNKHMRNAAVERRQKQMDDHIQGIKNQLQEELMSLKAKKGVSQEQLAKFQKKNEKTIETAEKAAAKNMANYSLKLQMVDYSGLTGLQQRLFKEEENTSLNESKIVTFIEDFETNHDKKDMDSLWDLVRKANRFSLNKQLSSGCIGRDTLKNVSGMYDYYIPLRAWNEETADDFYDYFFKDEHDVVNNPLMKANGRTSESGDPLASIASMAESAIFIGNKNIMKQHLLSLVRNYPTNMATVAPVWYKNIGDENGDVWQEVVPELTGDPKDDLEILEDFNKQMLELKEQGLAKQVSKGLSINVPIKRWQADQHAIKVKENGKEMIIYMNGDPRVAQAVNGLNNVKPFDNKLIKTQGDIKRFMTQNFTTRNPAFVFSNLSRDMVYAMTMNAIREDASYNLSFIRAIPEASSAITRYLTDKTGDNKYDNYFQEFISNGGETGFVALTSYEKYKKDIQREIERANKTGQMSDALHVVGTFFSSCNRWAEDMSRFSAYIASREQGRSIVRSVKDAKEVTVNFNRKGSGAGGNWLADMSYFFLNAGIQGMHNLSHTYKEHPIKASVAIGSWMMLGALMPLLYDMGSGGDDDYASLPDYIRQNNFVIPFFGKDNFITIPLPIEVRAFYGVGDILNQLMSGKYKDRNAGADMLQKLLDATPRNFIEGSDNGETGLAGAAFLNLTPDALKPIIEAYITNRSFTGRPIVKKNAYNTYIPEYRKVYKGTTQILVKSSQALNSITGGDFATKGWADSPLLNPAAVEHLFSSYMGGVGKTILQTVKSTVGPLVGEDVTLKDIPVANRFGYRFDKTMPNAVVNERYQKYVKLLEESQSQDREYKKGLKEGMDLSENYVDKKMDEKEHKMMIVKEYKNLIDGIASLMQLADDKTTDRLRSEIANMKFKMLEELDKMDKK